MRIARRFDERGALDGYVGNIYAHEQLGQTLSFN